MAKIIFVTGTDTGVGKTVLTALLLRHLRNRGVNALAIKPFSSGSRADARLLQKLADNQLSLDEVNPYYFDKPLAPFADSRALKRKISLEHVLARIQRVASRCDYLLVEGIGGVLVPLGADFFVADLIAALNCTTVLVARNKLGTINHTLLSVGALYGGVRTPRPTIAITAGRAVPARRGHGESLKVVLMNPKLRDQSATTNPAPLTHFLPEIPIIEFPYLGVRTKSPAAIQNKSRRWKKLLDSVAT